MTVLESMLGFDPFFAEFDRISRRLLGDGDFAGATSTAMPMDVVRRSDELLVGWTCPA